MPKSRRINPQRTLEQLRDLLQRGPHSAKSLCNETGISQPAFSRLIRQLGPELLKVGMASKTRYALKREVPSIGYQVPLYQIDGQGHAKKFGLLYPIQARGFFFESQFQSKFYSDLPYFLNDIRPNGFLGRTIPQLHPELGLPDDITTWSSDHVLQYVVKHGCDLIGNLIIGDEAFQLYSKRYSKSRDTIKSNDRNKRYEEMARDVLNLGDPGSSAGGEQSKFLATTGAPSKQVIVKFSPPKNESLGRRRADLLICEHLALEVLNHHKKRAARSEIISGKNRVFLEVERFDRNLTKGRIGTISLESMELEFGEGGKTWIGASKSLLDQRLLSQETHDDIRFYHLFGQLIANTDMHFGNLSFITDKLQIIELAPIYDMLPMLFAPANEQIVSREFNPPSPSPADSDIWIECWEAASDFWNRIAANRLVSDEFKKIANGCSRKIQSLYEEVKLLPS